MIIMIFSSTETGKMNQEIDNDYVNSCSMKYLGPLLTKRQNRIKTHYT